MKGLKRCLLFALSFALLSTALSIPFSSNASAASPYDDDLHVTDHIELQRNAYYGSTCSDLDMSLDWSSYLLDDDAQYYNYYGTSNDANRTAMQDSFRQALDTGSWGVSTYMLPGANPGQYERSIFVSWKESGQVSLNWYGGGVTTLNAQRSAWITFYNGNLGGPQNCSVIVNDMGNDQVTLSSENQTALPYATLYFYSNADPNYPDDYEGPDAPGEAPGQGSTLYPEVVYNVKQFNFSAFHNKDQLEDMGFESYSIKWTLYDHDSTEVLKTVTQDAFKEFRYDFKEYGTYGLDVEFQAKGIPYPPLPDEYDYIATKLKIKIDGTDYVSNTNNDQCDDAGECDVANVFEDCSTYGTDVIGGFGCHVRNGMRSLEAMLIALFLPSPAFFEGYWYTFTTFLNEKLGFLYQSIASIIGLFGGMITAAGTADCSFTPAGTIFGQPMNFDMCRLEQTFPSAWALIQTSVIGLTSVALIFAFQRRYHEAVDSR